MRGIESLIRIRRAKLEAERRKLAELEALAAGFARQIQALLDSTETEGKAAEAAPDAGHALGAFVQAALVRVQTLRASMAGVETEMAGVRGRIHEAFQELKRFEIARDRRLAQTRKAAGRRERQAEDEVGLALHRRGAAMRAG